MILVNTYNVVKENLDNNLGNNNKNESPRP